MEHAGYKNNCFYEPSISLVVQGEKESIIGDNIYHYGEMSCLVTGVDLPSMSQVIAATPEKPLLMLSVKLDPQIATEIATELDSGVQLSAKPCRGVSMARASSDIFDTFYRLAMLLERPEQISMMAPLLVRELITRIFIGPQGESLRMIYQKRSHNNHISRVIHWLKENYRENIQIDGLAEQVHMATSTFHRRFKAVTSISPLQYQKRLRLYEAQRLMLTENMDANTAAKSVGYQSSQQFNREYKRFFGEPPHRNIAQLRQNS